MMFVQHIVNPSLIWGRTTDTGHPGLTLFDRGGTPLIFGPFSKLDRQMNVHDFILGSTGSDRSASPTNLICQMFTIYPPQIFVAKAGNSFGLLADSAKQFDLLVYQVRSAPGSGVSLVPFMDAIKLVKDPSQVKVLDTEDVEASDSVQGSKADLEGNQ